MVKFQMGRSFKRIKSFRDAQKQWELSKLNPSATENIRMRTFIFRVIHEGFVGNIPVEILEKFPGSWVVVTFALTYFIFFGCYVGFFVWGYYEGLNQTFISLDSSAGLCNEVAKPLTGTFLASSRGVWEGSVDFKYSEAMYSFTFNDLATTYDEFYRMINSDFSLKAQAQASSTYDVSTNMLVWMHSRISVVTDNNKRQSMKLYSSPSDAFDRAYIEAGTYMNTVSTGESLCLSEYTSFDTTTAVVLLSFPNTTDCQIFIKGLGNLGRFDGDLYKAKMKLTSFTTVAAINRNILTMSHLERLAVLDIINVAGHSLYVNAMYDPTYQRADTFVCSDLGDAEFGFRDDLKQICFIDARGTMLLPNLGHADEHCATCDDDASKATVSCNYFGMLPFYIFFPALQGDRMAQSLAFLEFFQRVNSSQIRKAVSRIHQHQDTALFDHLCPSCGLIWAYLGDEKRTISPYRRQIPGGIHCVDSITSVNFSSLGITPPAQLVENYYECRDTVTNNILNSVGLAFGNTSVFAVLFLAVFLPILFFLTKKLDPHKHHVRKYVHGSSGHEFGSALVSRKRCDSWESSVKSVVELESPYDIELRERHSRGLGPDSPDSRGDIVQGASHLAESPTDTEKDTVMPVSSLEEESKRRNESCDSSDSGDGNSLTHLDYNLNRTGEADGNGRSMTDGFCEGSRNYTRIVNRDYSASFVDRENEESGSELNSAV